MELQLFRGTAVGTGMGCLPGFRGKVNKHLSDVLGYEVKAYDDLVDGMMAIDDLIACHGQVVALKCSSVETRPRSSRHGKRT